jgi:hypothetical protein
MPRRSKAALEMETFRVHHEPVPVQPPEGLSESVRAAFIGLVSACDPEHFETSDVTMLVRYATATILAARAETRLLADPDDGKALAMWEKAVRAMSGLALRLRLGPQSRREKAKVERPLTWDEKFRMQTFGHL